MTQNYGLIPEYQDPAYYENVNISFAIFRLYDKNTVSAANVTIITNKNYARIHLFFEKN
jgi:hypothetical protein